MKPQAVRPLAIRDIGAEGADRRTPACAHAIADREVEGIAIVERVAGVDEDGSAPVARDPVRVFDAAQHKIAPTHDGVTLRHADRLEGVAANRLVAAGAPACARSARSPRSPTGTRNVVLAVPRMKSSVASPGRLVPISNVASRPRRGESSSSV